MTSFWKNSPTFMNGTTANTCLSEWAFLDFVEAAATCHAPFATFDIRTDRARAASSERFASAPQTSRRTSLLKRSCPRYATHRELSVCTSASQTVQQVTSLQSRKRFGSQRTIVRLTLS